MGSGGSRHAKIFSYDSPQRKSLPSLLPDWSTVRKLIDRQDWRGLQSLLLDNRDWLRSAKGSNPDCLVAGKHPLHYALAARAPLHLIDSILDIDVDSVAVESQSVDDNERGFNSMHYALKYNNSVEILERLLQLDPNSELLAHAAADGRLPLHVAVQASCSVECITLITTQAPTSVRSRTKSGALPIHLALIQKCDLDVCMVLLSLFPESAYQSYAANLPFHYVCASKPSFLLYSSVLGFNPTAVSCYGEESRLPLHMAVASKCSLEIIKNLFERNPDALSHRDKTARMPIHHAIEIRSNDDVLQFLLDSCPESARWRGRGTPGDFPLTIALQNSLNASSLLALMKAYPQAARETSMHAMLPLRIALREQLPETVLLPLLQLWPQAAAAIDEHGRTACHYAASRNYELPLFSAILNAFPEAAQLKDRNEQLPLHLACIRRANIEILRELLQSYPVAASAIDRHRLTPLNYLIESDGTLESMQLLIDSDKRCLEMPKLDAVSQQFDKLLRAPDAVNLTDISIEQDQRERDKAEGKLALHHAIELKRPFAVIELLVRNNTESCAIAQSATRRVAMHLAILRGLTTESLFCIEKAFARSACVADAHGLFPVHYAVCNNADSSIVRQMLQTFPDIATQDSWDVLRDMNAEDETQGDAILQRSHDLHDEHVLDYRRGAFHAGDRSTVADEHKGQQGSCCLGHRLLLHYAIHHHTSPDSLAQILLHTMPFAPSGEFNAQHFYTWTHVLAHCNDVYWKSIELVLLQYENTETIVKLSEINDEYHRRALDIATPRCHSILLHRLHYFARYELLNEHSMMHRTHISLLKNGIDHFLGSKRPVVLKWLSSLESFSNEVRLRSRLALDSRFVIPLIKAHNADEDYNYKQETLVKRFESFRYLLVSQRGGRSLDAMIRHESISGAHSVNRHRVHQLAKQMIESVEYLHSLNVVHCNLHPGHFIESEGRICIHDFSFAQCIGIETYRSAMRLGDRLSSAYASPEIARLLMNSTTAVTNSDSRTQSQSQSQSQSQPLSIKTDMWSLGAVLFMLFTGSELFLTDSERCIDNEQLRMLSHWPLFAKQQRLLRISDPLARNLLDQLLSFDERLRPTATQCLSHPYFVRAQEDESRLSEWSPLVEEDTASLHRLSGLSACRLQARFAGMPSEFDAYISFRHSSILQLITEDNVDKLQRARKERAKDRPRAILHRELSRESIDVFHKIVDDSEHCKQLVSRLMDAWKVTDSQRAARAGEDSTSVHCVNDDLCRQVGATLSTCRSLVVLLSRFAINCEDLCLSTLTKHSPAHIFLFELRFAMELLSRGLLEGGVFVVAFGDLVRVQDAEMQHDIDLPYEYSPFFQHFQQEITLSSGNCFPQELPDISIDALEELTRRTLDYFGYGAMHFPAMTVKQLFSRLLRMPCIHVSGHAACAIDNAAADLAIALQRKFGSFSGNTAIAGRTTSPQLPSFSSSRPSSSAFQRMIDARLPSPLYNNIRSDSQTGGSSRGRLRSRGMMGHSFSARTAPLSSSMIAENVEAEHDIKFFNNESGDGGHMPTRDAITPGVVSYLQLHEQHQHAVGSRVPYFTDIVSLDKTVSEQMMHFLAEKMEVRDAEVHNLMLEISLMEERAQQQTQEIHRLRRLVRVTDTLDMDSDRDHDMFPV